MAFLCKANTLNTDYICFSCPFIAVFVIFVILLLILKASVFKLKIAFLELANIDIA